MRILVLADIHANWPALQALQEPFDVCLCLGDLVDYCLDPAPCLNWVRKKAQYSVRGNHDHGAAQDVRVRGQTGFKWMTGLTRPLTRERLASGELRFLASLPLTRMVTVAGTRIFMVHATPRDPLDEYGPPDLNFWTRRLQGVEADVICVGHTHQPYVLQVGPKVVVNPGSLGLPRDGDPRGAYAVIEDRRVELKRLEYPIEATVRTIQESSLPDPAKEFMAEILRTGSPAKAKEKVHGESEKDKPRSEA